MILTHHLGGDYVHGKNGGQELSTFWLPEARSGNIQTGHTVDGRNPFRTTQKTKKPTNVMVSTMVSFRGAKRISSIHSTDKVHHGLPVGKLRSPSASLSAPGHSGPGDAAI